MAEHQSSAEDVPAPAPELHREGNHDSQRHDGNLQKQQQQDGRAPEVEERGSESPRGAAESQPGELEGPDKPPTGSNSGTLAAESPAVDNRSGGVADLQGSVTTPNNGVKAESKEKVGPPEKEIIARETVQSPPSQTDNQVPVCSTPLSERSPTSVTQSSSSAPSPAVTKPFHAQDGPPEKGIIAEGTAQAPPSQKDNQLQVSVCSTPLSELSPTSVTLSSVPSPAVPKQKMIPPNITNVAVPELGKKYPSGGKTISVTRASAPDGYNWRKYGQKQVKSPTGSRSYYRCTHSDCSAKKIECCNHLGHVIDIVYRSEHSHDPPRKTNSMRESKCVFSNEPSAVKNSVPEKHPIIDMKDSDPSPSSKEPLQEAPCSTDRKRQNLSHISDNGKVILKEENENEPEPKKRMKKDESTNLDSPLKTGKKPKFVVHAAGDVGISGDGYRWRKYGQKMVKGNPHPRNYYRCTSAGCPVRKHIEAAVDNSNAVIITYKGVHDHDMPVPKKRHGPPSAPLVAAAAPASLSNLQLKKPDSPQKQKISTQWSVDTEGELTGEAMDLGGEKAIESARTLLSIGFEIKPC